MAAFEFDRTGVSHTAEQLDVFLHQLQRQQDELLQLVSEIARSEGQEAQATAVRRCAEALDVRIGEMQQCRTVLGSISDKVSSTELYMSHLTGRTGSSGISHSGRLSEYSLHPVAVQPSEASDFGLNFEESR